MTDPLLISATICAVFAVILLGWTVALAIGLLQSDTHGSTSVAKAAAMRTSRALRWLRIAIPLLAFAAILLVGSAFRAEMRESGRVWIGKVLLVGVPMSAFLCTLSVSLFCAILLEAVEANPRRTQAEIRKRFAGTWLLWIGLPAVGGFAILGSMLSGHGIAALLVIPAVGIWHQALATRVIRRFMKVSEWSAQSPNIHVSDLAAALRMNDARLMVWESETPDDEQSTCNAVAMGLGTDRSVFVFGGLLRVLDARQIRAIVAHEFAHHACHHHRKALLATAAFSGACTWAAVFASSDAREGLASVGMLLIACCGPFLLRAVSRAHEFEADRKAAEVVPAEDLASALEVLGREEPEERPGLLGRWLETHPPLDRRIERLRAAKAGE